MQTISITRQVVHGCPPRQFAVTFQVGDDRQVSVESGGRRRTLRWNGAKGYRPGSARHTEIAIEKFLELEASAQETTGDPANQTLDSVNELLAIAARDPQRPRLAPHMSDRQLPVADRA